jgi:hypothetical protein
MTATMATCSSFRQNGSAWASFLFEPTKSRKICLSDAGKKFLFLGYFCCKTGWWASILLLEKSRADGVEPARQGFCFLFKEILKMAKKRKTKKAKKKAAPKKAAKKKKAKKRKKKK